MKEEICKIFINKFGGSGPGLKDIKRIETASAERENYNPTQHKPDHHYLVSYLLGNNEFSFTIEPDDDIRNKLRYEFGSRGVKEVNEPKST